MRLYRLYRREDVSGVSGIGLVAECVVFASGRCVVSFLPGLADVSSVTVYDSLDDAKAIHGHQGRTVFVPVTADEYSGRAQRQEAKVSKIGRRRLAA